MAPTYYQIELSARLLTVLLLVLALVLVLAFAFGYGAAWSVLQSRQAGTPVPFAVATAVPSAVAPTATPAEVATAPPVQTSERPTATRPPRATALPSPTASRPVATALPTVAGQPEFWVQVLAVERRPAVDEARAKLAELGFPGSSQRVLPTKVAGGNTLYKLRVGPFPDRASADRVMARMQGSGFPDAWVVMP